MRYARKRWLSPLKPIMFYLTIVLICSSCHNKDNSNTENYKKKMTHHDEILNIMRDYSINALDSEENDWLSAEDLNELRKMKNDYFYQMNNPELALTIPGHEWELRGPLSIEQAEQERPEITTNEKWNEFKEQYLTGDEIYYYKSDKTSWAYFRGIEGYVLIGDNTVIDKLMLSIN